MSGKDGKDEKNEEMQNSISDEYGELNALWDARKKDSWAPPKEPWWTLEEWIKLWRATVKNSGNKRMMRYNWRMERIRIKPCYDLDGGSDEMAEEIWTPEKKRWKHLELEFIHQEQTPKKGIKHLDEIRIRFIVCLSFIKLNWWQAMDFAYYLFFLKRIKGGIAQNLRKYRWNHR